MSVFSKRIKTDILFLISILILILLPAISGAEKWKQVWSDEFSVNGLPDTTLWNYEEGFIRNKEMQYYTKFRLENARVDEGFLVIEGRKEKYPNVRYNPNTKEWTTSRPEARYTSASLTTRGKSEWKYGRIEVRAELPHGKGVWPAIWTLGSHPGWPSCGEIDIMEYVGHDPRRIHATVHYGKGVSFHESKGGKKSFPEPVNGFHVYAIEWFPDKIDFFFDDEKYFTFITDMAGPGEYNPFRQPHYLLLNLALGGAWGGEINDDALPQKFRIDYVRVYQSEEGSPGNIQQPDGKP